MTARDLDIHEDFAFHRAEWRFSRIAWTSQLIIIGATLLGVFGGGPLSTATRSTAGGALRVEYDRILRFGASTRLVVHARAGADGTVRITLDRDLLRGFRAQRVTPLAAAEAASSQGVDFRFAAAPGSDFVALFELQPAHRWRLKGNVSSDAGSIPLAQFVLP